jgi:ATP-dependent DNA helicase RecG
MSTARHLSLDTEIQYLKGVGPKVAQALGKLGVRTVRDALWYLPRRYDDRTRTPPLSALRPGGHVTVRGRLVNFEARPLRGGKVILQALLSDGTGYVTLTWFNQPWVRTKLKGYGGEVIAYGVAKEGSHGVEITSPEWETVEDEEDHEDFGRIVPVYPLSEGVFQKSVRRAVRSALTLCLDLVADPLPEALLRRKGLRPLRWCLSQIHQPASDENRAEARRRLVIEEFLYLQLELLMRKRESQQELGIGFPISQLNRTVPPLGAAAPEDALFGAEPMAPGETLWDEAGRMLPFELTNAQRRVIGEVWADMERPIPMNRLLQGDVGSGKTAVAACAMLAAARCGYQAALMAPTEMLAEQHVYGMRRLFEPLGLRVELLAGKLTARQKSSARVAVASGKAHLAIGTHALIAEGVQFHRLGLVVIDEQHRFGVVQRATLRTKSALNPDVLVMTATPIPRTLTMAMFGDLDVSLLDELPPGRKPVKTHWKRPGDRPSVYLAARRLVEQGRQVYAVCPMIADSEKMEAQAAEDLFARLEAGEFAGLRLGLLHGQMRPREKEAVMELFRRGELDVLVSTSVIEVGVDVPNASVMLIEDANRFGLAQLHQLRGRVGRGASASFCVLIADATTEEAQKRLEVIAATSDGFAIAEKDLEIRGPGEVAGTRQSGNLGLEIADLVRDAALLEQARALAFEVLESDPQLQRPENAAIRERVRARRALDAAIVVS